MKLNMPALAIVCLLTTIACSGGTAEVKGEGDKTANSASGAYQKSGDALPKYLPDGVDFDKSVMFNKDFDGAIDDEWITHKDKLCKNGKMRAVIVDVDNTAVAGNFLTKVRVIEEARKALNYFEEEYGVVYLSANFAADRMAEFFPKYGYPDVPLVARPRNYWGKDYHEWCLHSFNFPICEAGYKMDRVHFLKSYCEKTPERTIGLGDKFHDYYAYKTGGVCPIIVTQADVIEVNQKEMERGCKIGRDGEYAWIMEGKGTGDRCAFTPEKFILDWKEVEAAAKAYLEGKVECGEWKK